MRIGIAEMIYCTVLVFVILMADKLLLFLGAIEGIKPGSSSSDKVWGMIAFGMWMVSILALLTVGLRFRRNSERDHSE